MNRSAVRQMLGVQGRFRAQYGGTAMHPQIRDRIDSYETSQAEQDTFISAEESLALEYKDGCVICMCEFEKGDDVVHPITCTHLFHRECLRQWAKEKQDCPSCRQQFSMQLGYQPIVRGQFFKVTRSSLPAHEFPGYTSLIVRIFVPSGRQTKLQPAPGHMFKGIHVTMQLPDNQEAQDIVRMLRIAFRRRLLFRVEGNVLITNGVELRPFADLGYFSRVRMDLNEMGIS